MATTAQRDTEPFSDINITPMIDVMLVLLVMLILTIPVMSHKVTLDLPGAGGPKAEQTMPSRLAIARDGALSWDGRAISDAELRPRLDAMVAGYDRPVLHMQTDPQARYDRFDAVLAEVKRANVQRLGLIGDRPLAD